MSTQEAVDAVRRLYRVHDQGGDLDGADAAAAEAVTQAITDGARHDDIAAIAGVPGFDVVRLIRDDEARAAALCRERWLTEHYLGEVRGAVQDEALWWLECGVGKRYTATTFGISRPTLDAWLRDKQEAAIGPPLPGSGESSP